MVIVTYTNDFGIDYFTIPFAFSVKENNNVLNQYTINDLVPTTLINNFQNLQSGSLTCTLPKGIIYRKVQVYADDSNIYDFMFPYNFSNPNFSGCINDLELNTLITRFTIIGEKIKDYKLNQILGIHGY